MSRGGQQKEYSSGADIEATYSTFIAFTVNTLLRRHLGEDVGRHFTFRTYEGTQSNILSQLYYLGPSVRNSPRKY